LLRRCSFVQTPSWLLHECDDYLTHLSAISLCELSDVTRRLRLPHLHSKPAVMQVIVDDFVKEHAQFLDLSTSSPSYLGPRVSVFDYFNSHYGDIVFKAFRDLRTSVQFALTQDIFIDYFHLYEETWLVIF
jgi:hypothetical protein